MTHPNTPELDEILGTYAGKIVDIAKDIAFKPGTITAGDIEKYVLKAADDTEAALTRLLAKRELEGRIDEIMQAWADGIVAGEGKAASQKRVRELREELATYE